MKIQAVLADVSPWNEELDMVVLYQRLQALYPLAKPGLVVKVSDGISKYDKGILQALRGRDAGFEDIGPYHFHRTNYTPRSQADAFLAQWDKFPWTIRHSGDFETGPGSPPPTSRYEADCLLWYEYTDSVINAPGITYSGLSWIDSYFNQPQWSTHPLWLSQPPSSSNYQYLIGAPTPVLPWLFVTWHQRSFYNFLGRYFGSTGNHHIDLNVASWIPRPGEGIPIPPPEPEPEPEPVRQCRCIVNTLTIRAGPSSSTAAVGYLSFGDIVDVSESDTSSGTEWVQHSSSKGSGWSCHHTPTYRYMEDIK